MIGTLLAQDFRSTRKSLFTTIGIVLLVAIVSLVTAALRIPILGGLGFGLGVILGVTLLPIVFVLLAQNYWRTMYGREGYFTMTLPVRGRNLFTAKVLYGVVAAVVAAIVSAVIVLGVTITLSIQNGQPALSTVKTFFKELVANLELVGPAMPIFIACALVLQLVFTVVAGAAIMSIGAEARFNYLGFGAPVLGAVFTYFGMQLFGFAAMLFVPFGLRIAGPESGQFVARGMFSEFAKSVAANDGSQPEVIGLGMVFVSLIATVLFAWRGARSVDRRVSLR